MSNTDIYNNIEEGNCNNLLISCMLYFDLSSYYHISNNIAKHIRNGLILCKCIALIITSKHYI